MDFMRTLLYQVKEDISIANADAMSTNLATNLDPITQRIMGMDSRLCLLEERSPKSRSPTCPPVEVPESREFASAHVLPIDQVYSCGDKPEWFPVGTKVQLNFMNDRDLNGVVVQLF